MAAVPGASYCIIEDGQVLRTVAQGALEAGGSQPVTPDTPFQACSMSKLITAMTAMSAVRKGLLELDADVNRYLRPWRWPGEPITLRMLLSHQAGLMDPEGSFAAVPIAPSAARSAAPALRDLLEGVAPSFPPGSRFEYSDTGYSVVQQLLEDAAGEPFADLATGLVLTPLGMEHSGYEPPATGAASGHDPSGRPVATWYPYPAAAGLWSTPRDLSLAVLELCRPGKVLTPELAREMLTPPGAPDIGLGLFLDEEWLLSYGWGEGFQCMLTAHPARGQGAVVMINMNPGVHQLQSPVGETVRAIAREHHWPGF